MPLSSAHRPAIFHLILFHSFIRFSLCQSDFVLVHAGDGVDDPLGNVGGVVSDSLIVFGDHQQVKGVFALCGRSGNAADEALLDAGEAVIHVIVIGNDLFR